MLDRRVLRTDYAVSYGSVTLKSLQNDNIPELDLLVRESIQNSSDASLGMPGQSYNVNFTTGKFTPNYLRLSIQKWYAPKLHNLELKKFTDRKWLHATVNNIPMRKRDMLQKCNWFHEYNEM